ncbi:c-type cytochrome [Flavobacterium sp. ACAM 123]|uniref:c-type cytochrome n=1 Tax=Flavobacterium sp. ACAM 123 TaxID=1189620 RepID=UPI00031933E4|nr:cytochrome c [Flavobacterium sp. ACAM 123]
MRILHPKIFFLLLITVTSCQQNAKQQNVTKKVIVPTFKTQTSDSLSIDLVDLQKQGKLKDTTLITVYDDPVYHSTKRYVAIPLRALLDNYTAIQNLKANKYQIVFECEDGYKPMMPLQKFIALQSFLAVRDADAPQGALWSKIIKDGHEMKAAPFYLVYQGTSTQDTNLKWPYNLIKIHLFPNNQDRALLFPKNDPAAQVGFELFNKNCVTCHAINKTGGTKGPELNYPKSVTEYWHKNQLKAFIKNPTSFRNGVKMPTPKNLTTKEIDEIVYYLEYMANHKQLRTVKAYTKLK